MRAEDWEVLAAMRRQATKQNPPRRVIGRPAKKRSSSLGAILAAMVLAVGACSGGPLNPKTGPGTDYPCGTQGRSCGYGMCCGLSEECGYGLGCPAGYCCPLEDDFYGASSGAASSPVMRRQWREGSTSAK